MLLPERKFLEGLSNQEIANDLEMLTQSQGWRVYREILDMLHHNAVKALDMKVSQAPLISEGSLGQVLAHRMGKIEAIMDVIKIIEDFKRRAAQEREAVRLEKVKGEKT